MVIQTAVRELTAFVLAVRGDWEEGRVRAALAASAQAGWPFPKAALMLTRLAFDEHAYPTDLIVAARNPVIPVPGVRGDYPARAEQARHLLATRHVTDDP